MRILNFIFCSFVILFVGCDNNKEKIAKLEKEIESLRLENSRLQSFNNYTPPATPELLEIPDNVIENGNNYLNDYAQMSDARLLEEFKNYMSDEYFSFDEFSTSGKSIRIKTIIVDNIKLRKLQKKNPEIFSEILNRFDKIVFISSAMGNSITVNKLVE